MQHLDIRTGLLVIEGEAVHTEQQFRNMHAPPIKLRSNETWKLEREFTVFTLEQWKRHGSMRGSNLTPTDTRRTKVRFNVEPAL